LLDRLEDLGRARGRTAGQMALGWLLTQDLMAAPIVGANTPEQLADSLGAAGLKLNADEMRVLDEMSAWAN
jgi:aryl-alcohol dehydrogenase-like predicted oxidoreductase